MLDKSPDISVVIPIFNEGEVIDALYQRLRPVCDSLQMSFEIIFVDDGSTDQTPEILERLHGQNQGVIKVVRFSRNFGHQLAITAGLQYAKGKAVIIMDAGLQDPPEILTQFVKKWKESYEIVYGVRKERKGETIFKKLTATLFYKLIRAMTNIDIPQEVGDFYLLDRKVVDVLNTMQERHRFIRGLVAWVGYKRISVDYTREARFAGKTKYTFWRMFKFSFDAVTSFSFIPLRVVAFIGGVISLLAFIGILGIFYMKLFTDATIVGWSSLMVAVLFVGGIQLMAIGLMGEYLARIGDDVKSRPLYTISEYMD